MIFDRNLNNNCLDCNYEKNFLPRSISTFICNNSEQNNTECQEVFSYNFSKEEKELICNSSMTNTTCKCDCTINLCDCYGITCNYDSFDMFVYYYFMKNGHVINRSYVLTVIGLIVV